jgi:pSer/pThr/pTyr-binding forkhead associated (FHA) protein
MNALTLTLIRVAFLAVLWLFVIAAIGVVRTDMFGTTAAKLRSRSRPAQQASRQSQRPARSSRGAPRYLLVTGGPLSGMTINLTDQQITMGRANDATLVLNDDYASSRHARIFPQDGQWIVEDLGSTNGTYLDRQKVTRPTPVPVGVPIRIGKTALELRR